MVFSFFRKKTNVVQVAPVQQEVALLDPRIRALVHHTQERTHVILIAAAKAPAPIVSQSTEDISQAPAQVQAPPVPEALKNTEGPREVVAANTQPSEAQRGRYIGSTTATLRTKNQTLDQILSAETHQAMMQFGGKNSTSSAKGLTQFYLEHDFVYHEHPVRPTQETAPAPTMAPALGSVAA